MTEASQGWLGGSNQINGGEEKKKDKKTTFKKGKTLPRRRMAEGLREDEHDNIALK